MRYSFILNLIININVFINLWGQSVFDYMNQELPGNTPVEFYPCNDSSLSKAHSSPAFSPLGGEVYWAVWPKSMNFNDPQQIVYSIKKDGKWTKPSTAFFSGEYSDMHPSFTADGKKLFFTSNRPINNEDSILDVNIWYIEKKDKNYWDGPFLLTDIDNSGDQRFTSLAGNNNIYFVQKYEKAKLQMGIYFSPYINGQYQEPVLLPESINSGALNAIPCISQDESFIIFMSDRRGIIGGQDLLISYYKNGNWGEPTNLGDKINTNRYETFPYLSPDNKYLFFIRDGIVYWVKFDRG